MIGLTDNRWVLPLAIAVTAVLVAVAGVLAYDEFSGDRAPPDEPGPPPTGPTARRALRIASRAAEDWNRDAELAGATAHYARRDSGGYSGEWTFQFYSPLSKWMGLFVVENGRATLIRETLSPYEIPVFPDDEWRIDSDEALSIWWDQGGRYLVTRRPDAGITFRLRASEERPRRPAWIVTGTLPGHQSDFSLLVDAIDGSVLQEINPQ